jgi:hypothetical protein
MRFRDEVSELSVRSLYRDLGDPRNLSLDTGEEVGEDSERDGEGEASGKWLVDGTIAGD